MNPIHSYRSSKTEVKESPLPGRGFFAKEEILKGEIVAIKAGHIVNKSEVQRITEEIGDFCLPITDDKFLCPTSEDEVENTTIFINHSCEPNIGMDGQIVFVAMRDIETGEELTIDYAMLEGYEEYRLKCECGNKNCRELISGSDWQNEDLQDKYGNYFATHILKKIKQG